MTPFQFLTESSLKNYANDDVLVSIVDGRRYSQPFFWGSDSVDSDYYTLVRYAGNVRDFITTYNSLVATNDRPDNDFLYPNIPEIDLILLPYGDDGVLTFVSNEDHQNLPNFQNWNIVIDYRRYYNEY
jgi:hypothetical protein